MHPGPEWQAARQPLLRAGEPRGSTGSCRWLVRRPHHCLISHTRSSTMDKELASPVFEVTGGVGNRFWQCCFFGQARAVERTTTMDADTLNLSSDLMASASGYCLTTEEMAFLPPSLNILKNEHGFSRWSFPLSPPSPPPNHTTTTDQTHVGPSPLRPPLLAQPRIPPP